MKTTLNINDTVMSALKKASAARGKTMSELVETALRLFLESQESCNPPEALPSFSGGRERVDLSDRDALQRLMDDPTQH